MIPHALLQFIKVGARELLTHSGDSLHALFHTDRRLKHLSGRAAAAVPVAVGHQNVVVDVLILITHPAAHDRIGVEHAVVGGKEILDGLADAQRGDQVGQHLGTVNAAPHHRVVRYLVELVPRQFRRHKIFDAALFHNLRQCAGIAEHIRQPQNLVIHAKLFPEEALAMHKLSHKGLAGSQVAVGFQPHAALRFPPALSDPLPRFLVQLRVTLLQEGVELGLAGHKLIIRVFLHQLENRGKAASHFLSRLFHRPPPCHVDVRMADAGRNHILVSCHVRIQRLINVGGGFLQSSVECIRIGRPKIQKIDCRI